VTPRSSGSPRRSVVGAVLLALAVTGCSGDDDGPEAGGTTPSEPTSTVSPIGEGARVPDQALRDRATEAVELVVGRDHASYDDDVEAALPLLTDAFREQFEQTVAAVRETFVAEETTVSVDVVAAGVVAADFGGGQVLVYLDETSQQGDAESRSTSQAVLVTLDGPADALRVETLSADLATAGSPTEPEREAVVRAARDLVTPLINTGPRTAEADVREARRFATGPLVAGLTDAVAPLRETRATLEGVAGAVGVESITDDEATVLLAATVSARQGSAEPEQRTVRMRLELVRSDGAWLTRDLTFVD
jgi:hypothetical protein